VYVFKTYHGYEDAQKRHYLLALAILASLHIHALAMSQSLPFEQSIPYLMPCVAFASWMASLMINATPKPV
jgi:hypothetical protein